MRRPRNLAMSLAVFLLTLTPSASAHGSPPAEDETACPAPDVVQGYDSEHFSLYVLLPATGCPTRENRQFYLSAWLSRVDQQTGEGHGRVVGCGPFRASDADSEAAGRSYACELEMAIPHPSPEAAHYDVEVTYPGADGEETMVLESFCETDGHGTYSCFSQSIAR